MREAILRRKARSWVMKRSVGFFSSRNSSSHRIDSRSRWLVGSSSSSRSGCAGQRAGQQGAALQAAGEGGKFLCGRQPDGVDQVLDPDIAFPLLLMVVVVGPQAGGDDVVHRADEVGRDFLREPAVDRAGRTEDIARVGLHVAHDDLHQGGLARAVAPEQAHALARIDLEVDFFQDRGSAEVEADVEQVEQRSHGNGRT
jgi:hypothetical protein